jgi:hypothetical protein
MILHEYQYVNLVRPQSPNIEILDEIDEAIRRIERRFLGIKEADDFVRNDDGLDRFPRYW